MEELSLYILDIVQNSIAAKADLTVIDIIIDTKKDLLTIRIKDNGCGMDNDTIQKVQSPFSTSRTTRKVGLGIPFFKEIAITCMGDFSIESKLGKGTVLTACFQLENFDRPPMGDIAGTMVSLVLCNPTTDFVLDYCVDEKKYTMDTREVKQALDGVPINNFEVLNFIGNDIKTGINELEGYLL